MLSKIKVQNFKSVNNVELEINNITLLVGGNSSGKSTIIQSILLAVQNISFKSHSPLNGHLVSLGSFQESRNFITNAKEIILTMYSEQEKYIKIELTGENNTVEKKITKDDDELYNYLKYDNKHVKYLSSHRIGSRDLYNLNYDDITEIGVLGEYAIDYFEKNKSNPIIPELIKDKELSSTLEAQVNYWLSYILNGQLSTENIEGTDSIRASYRIMNSRFVRPKNVGAGLSYVISILITLLASKQGDINIIENPEIHLHPKAQSRLTEFLVFVSSAGVKLVIESHSDHIFNGIRKGIYKNSVQDSEISTYFFNLSAETSLTEVTKISFNNQGQVINHVEGLFDQFDDDLDVLLGID
ncbi:DUF3696 domain-containing protein [Bacillus mycoides]|uniref:DUF3696 domain-containing protein n=1 Tax=Bacillus mycoides TaxID=1405 RepID=UPI003D23D485